MRAFWGLAAAFLAACSTGAEAQQPASGVLTYPSPYFADAQPSTAYDMIGRVPGFSFQEGETVRGFAGAGGNVLIDGQRPTSKTDTLQSVLRRIPANNVERIDLIRGGAPGIDMQGQTVVANVIRKSADTTVVVATVEDRVFEDGRQLPGGGVELTRRAGGETYELSLKTTQSWDDSVGVGRHDVYDATGALVSRDVAKSHGSGIGVALKGAATHAAFGGSFKANFALLTSPFIYRLNYSRPGVDQTFFDKNRKRSGEFGLTWKGGLGPGELEALVLERVNRTPSANIALSAPDLAEFDTLSDTSETIGRATWRYEATPALTLETGGESALNTLDGSTRFTVNGATIPIPSANAHIEELRGEVFVRASWRFAPAWLLEGDARFERSTIEETGDTDLSRSFSYVKPRAALTWSPSTQTQVRLRYERVVGQLSFDNFIAASNLSSSGVAAGNANLRPDQRSQYEVSFEQRFWQKGAVVITALHEDITDVIDRVAIFTPTDVFDAPGNIGDGTSDEISVKFTTPLDRFHVPGGLLIVDATKRWSDVRDPLTGESREITKQRPQAVEVTFSQDLPRLKSSWSVYYFHGWEEKSYLPTQVRRAAVVAPFVNVTWDWTPKPSWRVHLEAGNVLRYVLADKAVFYTGPRNTSPVAFVDLYKTRSQPTLQVQLRKTF